MKTSTIRLIIAAAVAAFACAAFSGCAGAFTGADSQFKHREVVNADGSYETETSYNTPKEVNIELERDPETGRVVGAKVESRQNADLAAGQVAIMSEAYKTLGEATKAAIDKIPGPTP